MINRPLQTYNLRLYLSIAVLLLILFTVPTLSQAQMFSVDNSTRDRTIPDIAVYAGIEPMNFEFNGDSEIEADNNIYAFDGSIIRAGVEGRGLALWVGAGGSTTGIDDVSYFDAGIKLGYGFPLFFTPDFNVRLPIQLHSTITNVSNDGTVNPNIPQFDQGTLEIAGGLDVNAKFTEEFRFSANVIPSYGVSFSTRQRDASGNIAGVEAEGRLYFDHLFGSAGLSLGYNYNYRRYDIGGNEEFLDYKALGHSILIGVTF